MVTAMWIFASYFFLTVLSFQSLFVALPVLILLLVGLPLRLYLLVDVEHVAYGYLAAFLLLTFAIAIMISIDVVSSAKLVFKQLFEMHRQKECFRTILSSFPEGVLIAKVTKLSQVEAQQQAIIFGKKTGGASSSSPVKSQRPNSASNCSEDDNDMEEPIRVDVLFMNSHLQRFLGASKRNKFKPQEGLE